MRKKVFLFTENDANDPNIDLFRHDFSYRYFEVTGIITKKKISSSGGLIPCISLDEIPNSTLNSRTIVLLEPTSVSRFLKLFHSRGCEYKNLIVWRKDGSLTNLVMYENGEEIIISEGCAFPCKTPEEKSKALDALEMIYRTRQFYKIPPERYREEMSRRLLQTTKIEMNWEKPRSLQEKINWLNLYDVTPLKIFCSDKLKVREYVARKIGREYTVPLLGVWDDPDEIDFDQLPEKFVLKCNHGWNMHILVKDRQKFNPRFSRELLRAWMLSNNALKSFELYHITEPKIIAEPFLEFPGQSDPPDYSIACYNGKAKYIRCYTDRSIEWHLDLFDLNWNHLDIRRYGAKRNPYPEKIPRPKNLEKMISLAEKLSEDFYFVYVDFYNIDGRILLSEMTFMTGFFLYLPLEVNEKFGAMLKIPTDYEPFNPFKDFWRQVNEEKSFPLHRTGIE